jgi:CheY-like chemotaxis protein
LSPPRSILIVDTDEDQRNLVVSLLSVYDLYIAEAETGIEAVDKTKETQFGLILITDRIIDMTPLDLCKTLNFIGIRVPLIVHCPTCSKAEIEELNRCGVQIVFTSDIYSFLKSIVTLLINDEPPSYPQS